MKSIKILGIAVATLGVAASVGGAIALYTKAAQDVGFGIGAGEYHGSTGAVTYKIDGKTSGSVLPQYFDKDDHELDGLQQAAVASNICQVKYTFPLSATYDSDVVAQIFVMGNLSVSITNIPETYRDNLDIWAGITGYADNTLGAQQYANAFGGDVSITSETTSYEKSSDVCVNAAGGQSLVIYLKYKNLGDMLTANEASLGYTLSVTWAKHSNDFVAPNVVGTGNKWTADDEYEMVPNINKASAEGWEWTFTNLKGSSSWTEAKCKWAAPHAHDEHNDEWSSGDNATLTNNTTYSVYWNGCSSSAASFSPAA